MKSFLVVALCVAFAQAQVPWFFQAPSVAPVHAPISSPSAPVAPVQPQPPVDPFAPIHPPVATPFAPQAVPPPINPFAPINPPASQPTPQPPIGAPVQAPIASSTPYYQSADGTCPRNVDPVSPQFQAQITSFQLYYDEIHMYISVPYDQPDPSNANHVVSTTYTWVQQQVPPQSGSNLNCSHPGGSLLYMYEYGVDSSCSETKYIWGPFLNARDRCGIFARQQTLFDTIYSGQLRIQRLYNVRNGRISGQRTAESIHNVAISFPRLRTASTSTISITASSGQSDFASNLIFTSLVYNGVRWVGTIQTSTLAPVRIAPVTNGSITVFSAFSGPVATISNVSNCIGPNSVECRQEFIINFNASCDALSFIGSNFLYVLPNTFQYSCYPSALACPYPTPAFISTSANTLEIFNIKTSSACAVTQYNVYAPTPYLSTFDGLFSTSKTSFVDGDIVGLRLFLQPYSSDSTIVGVRALSVNVDTLGNLNLPTSNGSIIPVTGYSFCPQQSNLVCIQVNTGAAPFPAVPLNSVRYYTFNVTYEVIFFSTQQQQVRRAVFEQKVDFGAASTPATVLSRPASTTTDAPSRPLRASDAPAMISSRFSLCAVILFVFSVFNLW